jgi:glycosyltransferase involved in cell wall biosynthesis
MWGMVFIRNDIAAVEKLGIIGRSFYLGSRTSLPVLIKEASRFRREIHEFNPDLIHVHYGTVTAFFCAMLTRRPLVINYRGSDLNPCPGMNRARSLVGRWLSQFAALRASRIICVSKQLKERLWWNSAHARVLPSGVNTAVFRPMPKSEARAKLGWADTERVVISSAGTDPPRKRLDLAQASIAVAESLCGKIRFIVLDGHTEHKDIPLLFSGADCFLLTSEWEGSPNVVKEAMACSLPVVSVDVGDVRERLRDVHPSSLVSREPRELGAALARLLCEPVRSNGHEMVREVSAETIAGKVLSLYGEVLRDQHTSSGFTAAMRD